MDRVKEILKTHERCMLLRIQATSPHTAMTYRTAVETHNKKTTEFMDAGFDLYTPNSQLVSSGELLKIDYNIKCSAQMYLDSGKKFNTGFYLYPRSSISKTPLRLANSVGIIDAGYRGNIIGVFDSFVDCNIKHNERFLQICAPGLVPIVVVMVDKIEGDTDRGSGGFGSTGN